MERFNTEICQLGLRGLTVVVASGDDGVANFEARNNASACGFHPSFPTTSPYVTGVGATQGPEFGTPEVACSSATNGLITTGGGFSIFFNRPSYQDSVVTNYLQNGT
jgi:tripeptidyl-peptidase-1